MRIKKYNQSKWKREKEVAAVGLCLLHLYNIK
jgi:hypothetical protein